MSGEKYIIIVDDEQPLLDTYRQYLLPKQEGSALGKLRKLKKKSAPPAGSSGASKASAARVLPEGWNLVTAASGEEALATAERIETEGGEVCVGVFDVKMPPGIDGLQTMLGMLSRFPHMRCAVISAYNDRSVDDINALFDPAHRDQWDFMSKPFTEQEIRQKARTMARTWLHGAAERKAIGELEQMNARLQELVDERTAELRAAQAELAEREARMREELESAAAIQTQLFPDRWPDDGDLDYAAHVEAAVETGGDIMGYIHPSPDEVVVYVCDVTGHGAGAAIGTAILHTTLKEAERQARQLVADSAEPLENGYSVSLTELMLRLNSAIRFATRGSLYATCFLALLDTRRGIMKYASAGHEWPLLASEGETRLLPVYRAPVLGHSEDPHYPELEAKLGSGDVLLIYTDGILDAPPGAKKPFHRGRLFKTFAKSPKESADVVRLAIHDGFRKCVPAGTPLNDDVTYLVVRAGK